MNPNISIEDIDVSGDVRTAAEDAGAFTSDRRTVLRRGVVVGGSAVAATTLFGSMLSPAEAAIASGTRSAKNDIAVLKYALTLEYLESAFYLQALRNITWNDMQLKYFAQVAGAHEKNHVDTLQTVLGRKAIKSPTFAFGNAVTDEKTFAATAQVLEDTGVAAYAGQGGNLLDRGIIVAALSIHSVEARHASWIRFLNGGFAPGSGDKSPAPVAFDAALSATDVLAAVGKTGFITA